MFEKTWQTYQRMERDMRFLLDTHNEMQCALKNIEKRVFGLLQNAEAHALTPLITFNLEEILGIISFNDPDGYHQRRDNLEIEAEHKIESLKQRKKMEQSYKEKK